MLTIIDLNFQGNPQSIASFLLESNKGPILIETGPYSTFQNLKKSIENAGFQVEDIQHVLLTHIHLDHAGAAWAFAKHGAKVYLHPFGAKHMADPTILIESARRIYLDQMDILWGEMQAIPQNQLEIIQDRREITIGNRSFIAWHTPGHANHHIAWQMDNWIFAGDIAGVKIAGGPVVAPMPPPDIDIEKWQASIALLKVLKPEKFYIAHFGEVNNIREQLDELEENIWMQANWVKEHMEAGENLEQMIPQFNQWFSDEFRKRGLRDKEIAQYMAANPVWMSIAGLMRYWQKKNK